MFEGSIKDTKEAITRNIDMTSKITSPKSWRWDANWIFTAPTISNETYSEQRIIDEIPDTVINFIGRTLGEVQAWASSRKIAINAVTVDCSVNKVCGGYGNGVVIEQSVRSGIKTSNVSEITVTITSNTGGSDPQPTSTPESAGVFNIIVRYVMDDGSTAPNNYNGQTNADGSYSIPSPSVPGYKPNTAVVSGIATGNIDVTVTYKKESPETPTPEPTVEPTVQPTEEPTAEPTVQPTVEPTVEPTEEPTP